MHTASFIAAGVVGSSLAVGAPPTALEREALNLARHFIHPSFASPTSHASFDYGGVSRAHTGVSETLPSQLNLAHDAEWTVAIWVRNIETVRMSAVSCVFWGDNADPISVGHVLGLFTYFNASMTGEHGNVVAWVHGRRYAIANPAAPLDDDDWHLVAVRNRDDDGVFKVALSYDGEAWESEGLTPTTGIANASFPWSLNSMHDSRWGVPWIRRRNVKLDDLVVFDWALNDVKIKKVWNNGRVRAPEGGNGLYNQLESAGNTITYHLMFGGDGASSATIHKSYTDLNDAALEFQVEGAGAGVIDASDYPGS